MPSKTTIYVPEDGFPGLYSWQCPDCGSSIEAPFGGHTWTCHESYGGCGASFRPQKGFERVESASRTEPDS